MTYVKRTYNYVKFYYATEPSEDGTWAVWLRTFTSATCEHPIGEMKLIEKYATAEEAEEAANEFQSVSNK